MSDRKRILATFVGLGITLVAAGWSDEKGSSPSRFPTPTEQRIADYEAKFLQMDYSGPHKALLFRADSIGYCMARSTACTEDARNAIGNIVIKGEQKNRIDKLREEEGKLTAKGNAKDRDRMLHEIQILQTDALAEAAKNGGLEQTKLSSEQIAEMNAVLATLMAAAIWDGVAVVSAEKLHKEVSTEIKGVGMNPMKMKAAMPLRTASDVLADAALKIPGQIVEMHNLATYIRTMKRANPTIQEPSPVELDGLVKKLKGSSAFE